MTLSRATPETRIVTCSIRLLGIHLDASEPRTSEAVAGAIERAADALVTWHDAVVEGAPDHVRTPSRPPSVAPERGPAMAPEITVGVLERVAVAGRTTAAELDAVAAQVAATAEGVRSGRLGRASSAEVTDRLAQQGDAIAVGLRRLAESVAELGEVATGERHRRSPDLRRAATVLSRAENALRRTAHATGGRTS